MYGDWLVHSCVYFCFFSVSVSYGSAFRKHVCPRCVLVYILSLTRCITACGSQGPEGLVRSVARGTSSLCKKTIHGFCRSVGGLTGTIADTAAHATFDRRYIRKRIEKRETDRPEHILEGECVSDCGRLAGWCSPHSSPRFV